VCIWHCIVMLQCMPLATKLDVCISFHMWLAQLIDLLRVQSYTNLHQKTVPLTQRKPVSPYTQLPHFWWEDNQV